MIPDRRRLFLFSLLLVCLIPACDDDESPHVYESQVMEDPDWWRPETGLTWGWQLDGEITTSGDFDVIDIDFDVDESIIEEFQAQGVRVICYISVGSYERWRADADLFPDEVLGNDYEGWPGERWLDIRRIDLLAPIMRARLDACAAKGFDGVEPDNMELVGNDSGFPISYEDQLAYALWLADEAHARGLAIGQKNAPDMAEELASIYDFAILEDAFYYGWADAFSSYTDAGKPVFAVEYTDLDGDFEAACAHSDALGFSTILKHRDLGAWVEVCLIEQRAD